MKAPHDSLSRVLLLFFKLYNLNKFLYIYNKLKDMKKQILNEEFKKMQELAGIKNDNPVDKLITVLQQAQNIADENINNADNFDLVDFSQTIEKYIDELSEIGNFETYYVNEISGSDEDYDNFIDTLLDMAVKAGVLNQRNIDAFNRGDAPELMSALEDVWEYFEHYIETGQGISTSDYNEAVNRLDREIYSRGERSRDEDDEDIYK